MLHALALAPMTLPPAGSIRVVRARAAAARRDAARKRDKRESEREMHHHHFHVRACFIGAESRYGLTRAPLDGEDEVLLPWRFDSLEDAQLAAKDINEQQDRTWHVR